VKAVGAEWGERDRGMFTSVPLRHRFREGMGGGGFFLGMGEFCGRLHEGVQM